MTDPKPVGGGKRTPDVNVLEVYLNEVEVGTITHLPGDQSFFAFTEGYNRDTNRPILSLSFKTVGGGVEAPLHPTHIKVAPFFSNLLPEGHLREYLAANGGVNHHREFFLLWLLGQDLPGAVIVRPADGEQLPPTDMGQLEAGEVTEHLLRFSLAGVQLKFSAVMETHGGLTIPAEGIGGSWIVKLPSPRYPAVPEMEYAMMELARAVGIDVPEVRLVKSEELLNVPPEIATLGNALAIRRFDRGEGAQRIHSEDFAQVFDEFPHRKYEKASYEDMARILWAEAGLESVVEFSRRLAFSAVIGNADMHLKNWSIIYRDGRTAELSPAYDFVATIAYTNDTKMALSLGTTKDMFSVDSNLFGRFARKAGVPQTPVIEAAIETAQRIKREWPDHPATGLIPAELRDKVTEHMSLVPLFRE